MSPQQCQPCCNTPQVFSVPGQPGQGSFTRTTASFALPTIGTNVVVSVLSNTFLQVGLPVFIGDGAAQGSFQVFALPNGTTTSVVVKFLGYSNDSVVGTSILTGALVVPTGVQQNITLPVSLLNGGTGQANATVAALRAEILPTLQALTNLTDSTGGTPSNTLAAGVGIATLVFETKLIDITAATIILLTPGYNFKVLGISFNVEVAATTAAKLATLTPRIAGNPLTGGVLSLTSANCTSVGNVVNASAVTAGNVGTSAQTLDLIGSLITAFVEGSGYIYVTIQNLDTVNAISSLAAKINALQTGVGP